MLSSVFVIFLLMLIKDCMTSHQKWLGSCNKTFSRYFALRVGVIKIVIVINCNLITFFKIIENNCNSVYTLITVIEM